MPTPDEEIRAFLADERTADDKKLDMSVLYAESMLRELTLITADWQMTLHALRQAESDRARAVAATN